MAGTFRGTRTLRFLWKFQRGVCPVCNTKITRITVSRAGAFPIASPLCRVVPRAQTIASCFIQSATTGFTATIFPYRNRVSLKEAFEGLEPDEAKVSRPVLRGPDPSNGARLFGVKADVAALHCLISVLVAFGTSGPSVSCSLWLSPHFHRKSCVRFAQERLLIQHQLYPLTLQY